MKLSLPARWAPANGGRWSRVHDYFRYHGLWSPGVRMMRALPMRAKAALIALAFVLPTGTLTLRVAGHNWDQVRRTGAELAAAQHSGALLSLVTAYEELGLMLAMRRPLDGPVMNGLRESTRALVADLGPHVDGTLREAAETQLRALGDVAVDDPDRLRPAISSLSRSLRELQLSLMRHSGLSRNEDERIEALVTLGLVEGPLLQRELRVLREQSRALLRLGEGEAPRAADMAERRAALVGAIALSQRSLTTIERAGAGLDEGHLGPVLKRQLEAVRRLLGEVEQGFGGLEVTGDMRVIDALATEARQAGLDVRRLCNAELSDRLEAQRAQAGQTAARWALVLSLLLAVAVYLLMSFIRVLDGGVSVLKHQIRLLADGDLTSRPHARGRDDVALVLQSLGEALSRLSDLLSAVRHGAGGVSFASQEIAQGSNSLSRRTESALERMNELLQALEASMTGQDQSRQRTTDGQLAVQALRVDSLKARRHMDALVQRMSSLQEHSRDIGEIVNLIDGIAYRTNILALNASVEAAKAGEAGRGFAVVAQEVRTLAQRSAASARRISEIVESSTRDIAEGHGLTARAGESLTNSARHVEEVHQAMETVAQVGRDSQHSARAFIDQVRELQSHAQDNRKLVSQLSDAADALQRQSERLARKVDSYRVN